MARNRPYRQVIEILLPPAGVCERELTLLMQLSGHGCRFGGGPGLVGQMELPDRACRDEVARDAEGAAGFGRDRRQIEKTAKGEQPGGFGEADIGPELSGGGAKDTATEAIVERTETLDLDRDRSGGCGGADGAASAADGLAGK